MQAGQFPEAKARAVAALALDPKNVRGLVLLGNALAGVKDLDAAVAQMQTAIDADSQRDAHIRQSRRAGDVSGTLPAAEAAFKRAVEVNPKSADAHLALANYFWAANQREDAERELKLAC